MTTVKELIEYLQEQDQDLKVEVLMGYNDYIKVVADHEPLDLEDKNKIDVYRNTLFIGSLT